LKSIIEEIVGDKRGKDFIALISFVIVSGSIAKGIQSGKVFSSRLLRTSLIRILNNYLDLTLDVVRNSLGFIILVLSIVFILAFVGNLIILRKKAP